MALTRILFQYVTQSFQVSDGIQLMTTPTSTIGGYPRRIYIFMVMESAVVGALDENPMHWRHLEVDSLSLSLAGNLHQVLNMDFRDEGAINAFYQTVCRGLGVTNRGFAYNYLDFQVKLFPQYFT